MFGTYLVMGQNPGTLATHPDVVSIYMPYQPLTLPGGDKML